MSAANTLWNVCLWPLAMITGVLCWVALTNNRLLSAACLGVALLAAVVQLAAAERSAQFVRLRDEALADAWDGQEVTVNSPLFPFLVGIAFAGVVCLALTSSVFARPRSWVAWALAVASITFLVVVIVWTLLRPRCLLRVTRFGIWDPNHHWVEWTDVLRIAVREERRPNTTMDDGYLQLQLRPGARHQPRTMAVRSRRGIARPIHDGSEMEYRVTSLGVHPRRIVTAARACWALAKAGPGQPSPAAVAPQASASQVHAERKLAGMRTLMRRSTRVFLAAWLFVPLAYATDTQVVWSRFL